MKLDKLLKNYQGPARYRRWKSNNEEIFLQERIKGIGGTDAAAIMGVNPWKTAYSVWLDKKEIREKEEQQIINMRMLWGSHLEGPVCDFWNKNDIGQEVVYYPHVSDQGITWFDRGYHFLQAHVDAYIIEPQNMYASRSNDQLLEHKITNIVEVKCVSYHGKGAWYNEYRELVIPKYYQIQAQHYMGIMGMSRCLFLVLFEGNNLQHIWLEGDRDFQRDIARSCIDWWNKYIIGSAEPPIEADKERREDIHSRWGDPIKGFEKEATPEIAYMIEEWKEIKEEAKIQRLAVKEYKNAITNFLGGASVVVNEDGVPLLNHTRVNRKGKPGYSRFTLL